MRRKRIEGEMIYWKGAKVESLHNKHWVETLIFVLIDILQIDNYLNDTSE